MEDLKGDQSDHNLMDERLVHAVAMKQFKERNSRLIAKRYGFNYHDIDELHFEYKKIQRICNLWEFTSLVKLQLNSNHIERIQGLECLVNLKWLDLSVNRIEKIEGLESLWELEVLNLTNNRISVIENIDSLRKLTHLYIANNCIQELDVVYLAMFEDLFILCIHGNPVNKNARELVKSLKASSPKLIYLDNVQIRSPFADEREVNNFDRFGEIRCLEEKPEKSPPEQSKEKEEAELKLHEDAYVEFLKGSHLFESMFEDDPEADTLTCVPGVTPLLLTFKSQMVELCEQLFELGLDEHKQRESELNSFNSGWTQGIVHFQQKPTQIMEAFLLQRNETVRELRNISDPDQRSEKLNQCQETINQLSNNLMKLEFQLTNWREDIIKKLVNNISTMIGNFIETAQGIFTQCRDLEDNYYEKVKETAGKILEDVTKDDCYLPDNVQALFKDKEAVRETLTIGHDNHLTKISDRETQLITRANAWKATLFKEIQDRTKRESQERLTEINRYADYLKGQLQEVQQPRGKLLKSS